MTLHPISEPELLQYRKDTPGAALKVHFNNAGASLPAEVMLKTVISYLEEEATYGGYEVEAKYTAELENVYALVAKLINAHVDEVSVAENASMAWSVAFNGIGFQPGDVILTTELEYSTNLLSFLHAQKTKGVEFKVIPNDAEGNVDLAALEQAVTPAVKLIAVTHIASATGSMAPVEEIGKIARRYHILYMVDACQSAGQVPIDVQKWNCDILSATGRKYMRAPRGTGFLYVRKEIQEQLDVAIMDGHTVTTITEDGYVLREGARRFEVYEKNRAIMLGLGKAIEYALNIGIDRIWERIQLLATELRKQLSAIEGVTVHDKGNELSGIVTFTIEGVDNHEIKRLLEVQNINTSVSVPRATLFYMNRNQLPAVVRASVHYYNTENEFIVLVNAVREISGKAKFKLQK